MAKRKVFKVGNKIIEKGRVYKVYKIENEKIGDKVERIIHFRPYFKNSIDGTLVCSIPECNIDHITIRKPVSKNEVGEMLEYLSRRSRKNKIIDVIKAKPVLNLNDMRKTAKIIKRCWWEKKDSGLTKTKKDILEVGIERIVEEVALVTGVSIKTAREKITIALG
jgi:RNA polymerase-interacting CarD/CdnL/TRCF family regulator